MQRSKTFTGNKSTLLMLGLFLSLFLFTNSLTAQDLQVKGIVKGKTEEKTEILNGANIYLKNSEVVAVSNKKGEFTFPKKLKVGDVLIISYLGYLKKKITINSSSTFLNVVLMEDENQMLGALNSTKPYKTKRTKQ